jgi:tetratricopeptide (TPR) repeat protein
MGRLDPAAAAYQEAIDREPGRAQWHSNLGGIRARQYRLDEALQQYERAIDLNPELPRVPDLRDQVLLALDQPSQLVEERKKAAEAAPKSVVAKIRLARAHDLADEPGESIGIFQEAVALLEQEECDDAEDLSTSALYLEIAPRMQARARYGLVFKFLKAAETAGAEPRAVAMARGNAYLMMSRGDAALAELAALSDEDQQAPFVRLTRAQALSEAGRFEEAEAELRDLLEIYPGNPAMRAALGHTLMWVGQLEEATEHFEQASKINPGVMNRPELSGGSIVWETGAYGKDHEPEALSAGATRACRADGARA